MPGNGLLQTVLEWEVEGTRRKGIHNERWMDGIRRSVNNRCLAEEGTGNRDRRKNLVLGGGKLLFDILDFVNNFRLKDPPPQCFGEIIVSIFRINGRWTA
jgi:hypothetical protein